jgi:uncharacterized membrane protein YoaK (UPF0700 family)
VFLGLDAAGAAGPSVPRVLAAVVSFAVGAGLGAMIVAATPGHASAGVWPHPVTVLLAVVLVPEVAFLALWVAVGGMPSAGTGHALVAVSGLAMGMQTSAMFSLGVRAVFTTAATATLAVLMGDMTTWSRTRAERRRLAGVIAGLLAGVVAGAYLVGHARTWAPLLPVASSGAVVAVAAWHHGRA